MFDTSEQLCQALRACKVVDSQGLRGATNQTAYERMDDANDGAVSVTETPCKEFSVLALVAENRDECGRNVGHMADASTNRNLREYAQSRL